MRDGELNLIHLELERHSTSDVAPSQLAHQIESIAAASRTMETALQRERTYSKQLRDYAQQILTRMHFLQKNEKEATERLKELEAGVDKNRNQIQELTGELEKARHELSRYRNAWGQIQAREKHAQYILSRGEMTAKRIQELEIALSTLEKRVESEKMGREKAEGHAASHRQELQSVLVRLHSSEARYNDMARELEAIHTLRKNHTLELSRVEQIAREKLEAQFSYEREKLVQELTREREDLARYRMEFERNRGDAEQAKEKLRLELEAKFSADLKRVLTEAEAQRQFERQQAQELLQREKQQFNEVLLREKQQSSEVLRSELASKQGELAEKQNELLKLESIIRSLGEESKALREELSDARTEVSTVEEASRQAQLELLRAREEVKQLQMQQIQIEKQLSEERGRKSALDETAHAAEKEKRELAKELEAERERSMRSTQELCELIQADRKQMQRLVERLVAVWGPEDAALREALEALRNACEVRSVRTEAAPAKLEIVTGGSRLNC
jgi:chromosome segregation ATPase